MQEVMSMHTSPMRGFQSEAVSSVKMLGPNIESANERSIKQAKRGIDIIYAGPIGHLIMYQETCIGAINQTYDIWYGAATSGVQVTASTREEAIEKLVEAASPENC